MVQRSELSDREQRVYDAVTALEARGSVPFPAAIAEAAGMTEEELDGPLRALSDRNILHREDTLMPGLDFGPRWFAVQPV